MHRLPLFHSLILAGLLLFSAAATPITTPAVIKTNHANVTVPRDLDVLIDPLARVSDEFDIPKELYDRTRFWFDIYTKYGEAHHIIHHARYPWIIFEAVDTSDILYSGKGATWYRRQKAQNFVLERRRLIRRTLEHLARNPNKKNLSPLEQQLMASVEPLGGSIKKVLRSAASNMRSQLGQRDFFVNGLVQSQKYLPYMEEIFARAGLPADLTRLPFVESSFNTRAESRVGASGIWQIMPFTGQAYMKVDNIVDERNSPIKATQLAAKLLKQYFRALDQWPLAVTSYNHGIGNIRVAMRAARSKDLAIIIERYHRGDFKFASSNFFCSFLAALYAERYKDVLFNDIIAEPLIEREIVKLERPLSLKRVMQLTGLSKDLLLGYNLDIRKQRLGNILLPRGYELHLPQGYGLKLSPMVVLLDISSRKRAG